MTVPAALYEVCHLHALQRGTIGFPNEVFRFCFVTADMEDNKGIVGQKVRHGLEQCLAKGIAGYDELAVNLPLKVNHGMECPLVYAARLHACDTAKAM